VDVTYHRGPVMSMFPTESERSTLREPGAGSGILSKELGRSKRKYQESVLRQEMDKSAVDRLIDQFAGEYLGAIDLCLLKFAAARPKFKTKPGAMAARKVPDPVTDVKVDPTKTEIMRKNVATMRAKGALKGEAKGEVSFPKGYDPAAPTPAPAAKSSPLKARAPVPAPAPEPTPQALPVAKTRMMAPSPKTALPIDPRVGGPPRPSPTPSAPAKPPDMVPDSRGGKTVAPSAGPPGGKPSPALPGKGATPTGTPGPTAMPMADPFGKGYSAPAPVPAGKGVTPTGTPGPTAMPMVDPFNKGYGATAPKPAPSPTPTPAPSSTPAPAAETSQQKMTRMMGSEVNVPGGGKAPPKRLMEDIRMGGKAGTQAPPPGATTPTEFKPSAKPETPVDAAAKKKGGKGGAAGAAGAGAAGTTGEFTQEQMQRFQEAQMGGKGFEAWKQKQNITEMPDWKRFAVQTGMGIAPALLLNAMGVEGMVPWMLAMSAPQFAMPYAEKWLGHDPKIMSAAPMGYAKGQTRAQMEKAQASPPKEAKGKAAVANPGRARDESGKFSKSASFDILLERLHQASVR